MFHSENDAPPGERRSKRSALRVAQPLNQCYNAHVPEI
jgi:hypothetical protein